MKQKSIIVLLMGAILVLGLSGESAFADYDEEYKEHEEEHDEREEHEEEHEEKSERDDDKYEKEKRS